MRTVNMSDLFKKIRERSRTEGVADNYKTVGLVGLCAGAGTTQLSVMLANYFSNGLDMRTAVVSIGEDDTFERISKDVETSKCRYYTGSRQGFSYKGIDFFGGVRDGFVHVITKYYDVVIVKINLANITGKLVDGLRDVFSCEYKLLVGSMAQWKYRECIERLERVNRLYSVNGLSMATVTWQRIKAQELARDLGVRPLRVPYEENPFEIRGRSLLELRRIVAR